MAYNHRQQVSKWWFHLYNVLQNTTQSQSIRNGEVPDGEGEVKEELDSQSWFSTLHSFMESSTLGDMNTRLEMVLAFHHQLTLTSEEFLSGLVDISLTD